MEKQEKVLILRPNQKIVYNQVEVVKSFADYVSYTLLVVKQ